MRKPEVIPTSGTALILAAALLWGTTGTAQTFAPEGFDPLVVGTLRLAIGGIALLVVALARGELGRPGDWPIGPMLAAALGIAAFQASFFDAVARTGVAIGTIVAIGSAPVFTGALALLWLHERPGRRWLGATLLALAGCSLLVLTASRGPLRLDPNGILLALGAGAGYSGFVLAVKKLLGEHAPAAVMAVAACLGTLLLLPLAGGRELGWLLTPRGGLVVSYLGLFTMAAPMLLFARGLRTVPAATAVTLNLVEPTTAGLLAVLLVGERLATPAWGGLALILAGLVLLALPVRRGPGG